MEKEEIDKWDGNERRTVPVHLISYVDKKIEEVSHKIDSYARDSEQRHHILVDKITHYQGQLELTEQAFLKTSEGHPDYDGHRHYHLDKKTAAEWWNNVRQNSTSKVFEWGIIGILAWMVSQFLQGR